MADGGTDSDIEQRQSALEDRATIAASIENLRPTEKYLNRELSWLQFNMRVLEEAENKRHPLLERVRFLSISGNNLDEFYMVRVAGLRGQCDAGVEVLSDDGLSPIQQLKQVNSVAENLMAKQQQIWASLNEEMRDEGIAILEAGELS